jgi:hypothetical protein
MELGQFEWNLSGMFDGLGTCFVVMFGPPIKIEKKIIYQHLSHVT